MENLLIYILYCCRSLSDKQLPRVGIELAVFSTRKASWPLPQRGALFSVNPGVIEALHSDRYSTNDLKGQYCSMRKCSIRVCGWTDTVGNKVALDLIFYWYIFYCCIYLLKIALINVKRLLMSVFSIFEYLHLHLQHSTVVQSLILRPESYPTQYWARENKCLKFFIFPRCPTIEEG